MTVQTFFKAGGAFMKINREKRSEFKLSSNAITAANFMTVILIGAMTLLFLLNMKGVCWDSVSEKAEYIADMSAAVLGNNSDNEVIEKSAYNIISDTDAVHIYAVSRSKEIIYDYSFNGRSAENAIEMTKVRDCIADAFNNGKSVSDISYISSGGKNYRIGIGFAPIKNDDGFTEYVVCVETDTVTEFPYVDTDDAAIYVFILILVGGCMIFQSGYNYKKVIKPIEEINLRASSLIDSQPTDISDTACSLSAIIMLMEEIQSKQDRINESLKYAQAIQVRLISSNDDFGKYFSDSALWWFPLDVVSGDFCMVEAFPKGRLIILGDCTGHGIPGALMTMMATTIITGCLDYDNCDDTARIIWNLDRQFSAILNSHRSEKDAYITHGLDVIALFVDNYDNIRVSSAGINLFVSTSGIKDVKTVRGQRLYIGDGKISDISQIKVQKIKVTPKDTFFIASDGLFEQTGGNEGLPLGYSAIKKIIHRSGNKKIPETIEAIKEKYFEYKGDKARLDDVTVMGFKP